MLKLLKISVSIWVIIFFALSITGAEEVNFSAKNESKEDCTYWHGDTNKPEIALTFDDGPNEPYTSEILDILKANNVKATFFLVGENVEKYPEVARRIVKEGNAIGNHTYNHRDLLLRRGILKMGREIDKTEEAIYNATGTRPRLFRPPFGSGGYVEAKNRGYAIIKWSVSAENGGKEIPSEKIVKNVVENVTNGSIILIHDGRGLRHDARRNQAVEALPIIIKTLKEKGYQFVTVPELIGLNK